MKVFTVEDTGASFFLPPFTAVNQSQAVRMFIGSLGDSFPFRQDFNLYHIGDFDEANGALTSVEPVCLLRGASIDASLDPRVQPQTLESAQ